MESRITNTTIVALIVGLIIGFAGGAYWYKGKMSAEIPAKITETEEETSNETEEVPSTPSTNSGTTIVSTVVDGSIVAAPNQSAGSTALVSKVTSNTEIWVAVREDNGGLMGNILGAKKVSEGVHENVVVELLRPTVVGSKYYVVLFRDNGDGAFDFKTDTLIESDGSTVVSTFRAQ